MTRHELLVPLARAARPDGCPACRLLVGTRSWDEFAPLLALAEETGEVIDLDAIPPEQRRGDVVDYVTALLELLPGYTSTAHSRGRRAFAAALAAALVPEDCEAQPTVAHTGEPAPRWGEFLVAALFTHTVSLTQPRRLTDPAAAAALGARVPRTLPEVLELDLGSRPPSRWRRPLLTALAHARGNGLPRSLLAGVVAAVAGRSDAPTAEQLGAELDALRFYLRASADTDASALYRLFHQGLADHLRGGGQPARGGLAAVAAGVVLDGLLASIPTQDGRRRWDLAAPYLLRHAIEHAAAAGRVDELLDDPGFLVHANPTTLAPLLHLATTPSARLAAAVYRSSAGGHLERSPEQRRDVLAIDAARYGAGELREAICALPGQPELLWQPRWATGGQISTALRATLTGHTGTVWAVGCTEVDGTPVAVTGGYDQTVRVWDLRAGAQIGEPLTGHTATVWAVACTEVDGTPVAVTAGDDQTVRVWDLRAGGLQDVVELPTTIGAIAVGRGNVLVVGIGWDVVALAPGGGR
ncbi:MAG: WD40 repeat domain-containing protein [Pseudonocardia sp.]